MNICLTSRSVQLLGSYFKRKLPNVVAEGKTYQEIMKELYNEALNEFKSKTLSDKISDEEIILQHMSLVPQLLSSYLTETPSLNMPELLSVANANRGSVYEASQSEGTDALQEVFNNLSKLIGAEPIKITNTLKTRRFEAISSVFNKVVNQEAVWDPKTRDYSQNVTDPQKQFEFNVQRYVIANNNGNNLKFKMVTLGEALEFDNVVDTTDVTDKNTPVLVLVDSSGNIARFNERGSIDANGNVPIYLIKTKPKQFLEQKRGAIESLVSLRVPKAEAVRTVEERLNNHLAEIEDARMRLKNGQDVFFEVDIENSSLGFVEINQSRQTPLRSISNLQDLSLMVHSKNGSNAPALKIPFSNELHRVQGNPVESWSEEDLNNLIELLTNNNLTTSEGRRLTKPQRKSLIQNYIQENLKPGQIQFSVNFGRAGGANNIESILLNGKRYTISAPKVKAETQKKNRDAFEQAFREFISTRFAVPYKGNTPTNYELVDSVDKVTFEGQVIRTNGVLMRVSKPEIPFNVKESSDLGPRGEITVVDTIQNGVVTTKNIKHRDHILDNGYTTIVTNANNEVRAYSSYLAFANINFRTNEADNADDSVFYRSLAEINNREKVSEKEEMLADKWYQQTGWSSVLNRVISKEAHERGPQFVASFMANTISLYKGSNMTDLYHEVFHAYTQGILSAEERTAMYNEIRSENKGKSFTTVVAGVKKTTSFAEATELELDEYLAEEFRAYARNKSKYNKKLKSKVAQFFELLKRMFDSLFGNLTYGEVVAVGKLSPKVAAIFNDVYEGNVDFSKFQAPATNIEHFHSFEIDENIDLSIQQMHKTMTSMQSLLSTFIRNAVNSTSNPESNAKIANLMQEMATLPLNDKEFKEKEKELMSKIGLVVSTDLKGKYDSHGRGMYVLQNNPEMLKSALTYIKNKFQQKYDQIKDAEGVVAEEDAITLETVLENFGDINKPIHEHKGLTDSIVSVFLNEYTTLNLEEVPFIEDIQNDTSENLQLLFDRSGAEQSLAETVDSRTKELLSTLIDFDNQGHGSIKLNSFGIGELAPFGKVLTKVARIVDGTITREDMYRKLEEAAKEDKVVAQLLSRLGNINNEDISLNEQKQWTSFWQSLTKASIKLRIWTIEKEDDWKTETSKLVGKSGKAKTLTSIIRRQWAFNFQYNSEDYKIEDSPFAKMPNYERPVLIPEDILEIFSEEEVYVPVKSKDLYHTTRQPGVRYGQPTTVLKADPAAFLRMLGIDLPSTKKINNILNTGSVEYGIPSGLMDYITGSLKNRANAVSEQDKVVTDLYHLFKGFKYKVDVDGKVASKPESQESLTGYLELLASMAAELSEDYTNFMAYTPQGEKQSEKSFHSSLSNEISVLNAAQSYQDVINTPGMEHFNIDVNPFAAANKTFVQMFNLDLPETHGRYGERNQNIEFKIENLVGSKVVYDGVDKGIKSIHSDELTKFNTDFHQTLVGGQEILRSEAKSTSYIVYSPIVKKGENKARKLLYDKYETDRIFSEEYDTNVSEVDGLLLYDQFEGHIEAELIRIRRINALKERIKNGETLEFDPQLLENGDRFYTFDLLLSDKLKKKLLKLGINTCLTLNDWLSVEDKKEIDRELKTYFQQRSKELFNEKNDELVVADNFLEDFKIEEEETERTIRKRMFDAFVLNNFISSINYSTLFLGDPAVYKVEDEDFHKRIAGKISTGKLFLQDDAWYNFVNSDNFVRDGFAQKYHKENDIEYVPTPYTGHLNTGVISEAVSKSVYAEQYADLFGINVSEYEKMKEADGAAWISFDTYRLLAMSSDEWSQGQEELYQRMLNGESIDQTAIKNTFPVRKYQYYGPVSNNKSQDYGLQQMAFHKYSLIPLIPKVIEGTQLQNLHEMMMKQGLDYVTVQSGSKLSTITPIDKDGAKPNLVYQINEDKTRQFNSDVDVTLNRIHVKHLKSQVYMSEGFKGYITLPSQMRKMALLGMMSGGVPTDFSGDLAEWDSLTEAQKRETSSNYDWVVRYENVLEQIQDKLRDDLLEEIGLTESISDQGEVEFIGNKTKLIDYLKRELRGKDLLPEEIEIIEYIDDFSGSLNSSKIEEILVTMVDKKLRALKINGEGLVQVPGTMFESAGVSVDRDHTTGSNDLKTYYLKNEDGTIATTKDGVKMVQKMEVKIALQGDFHKLLYLTFNGETIAQYNDVVDEKTNKRSRKLDFDASLNRLNEALRDDQWRTEHEKFITISGPRIPTQAFASLEAAYVKEFLPPLAGTAIVLPSEIVAKAGSDYDIDKLFLMFPNIKMVGKDVYLQSYKQSNESNQELVDQLKTVEDAINKQRKIIDGLYKEKESLYKTNKKLKALVESDPEILPYTEANAEIDAKIDELDDVKTEVYNAVGRYSGYTRADQQKAHALIRRQQQELRNLKKGNNSVIYDKLNELLKKDTGFESVKKGMDELQRRINERNEKNAKPLRDQRDVLLKKWYANGIGGLQNQLLDLFAERVTNPKTIASLVEPNSTDMFDDIADELGQNLRQSYNKYNRLNKKSGKTIARSTIFDYRYNLLKHQENSVGLEALGVAAVTSTYYAVFTKFGAYLEGVNADAQKKYSEMLKIVSEEMNKPNTHNKNKVAMARDFLNKYKDYKLRFPHNSVKVDKSNRIALGVIDNVDGLNISDVIGQLINGYVDVAKKPWIFNIQGNMQNTPQLLFMIMAGVSIENVTRISSLPMVVEYNKIKAEMDGVFSSLNKEFGESPIKSSSRIMKEARAEMYERHAHLVKKAIGESVEAKNYRYLANRVPEINTDVENGIDPMMDMIQSDQRTYNEFLLLNHYFEIEDMSNDLTDFTMATKFDTQKIKSISDGEQRQEKIKDLKSSENAIPNNWYDEIKKTPIGIFDNDKFISQMFSQYFGIRNNEIVVRKSTMVPNIKGVVPTVLRTTYKDHFLWYLYQNSIYKSDQYNTYRFEETEDADIDVDINEETKVVLYNEEAIREEIELLKPVMGNMFNNVGEYIRYSIERQNIEEEVKGLTDKQLIEKYYYVNNSSVKSLTRVGIINKLALYRSDNPNAYFNFRWGISTIFKSLVRNNPELSQRYDLIHDMRYDYDAINKKANLFIDDLSDPMVVKKYRENLKDLKNSTIPEVAEFFRKFDHIAIMQSGLSRGSKYDLVRIVDQNKFYNVIEEANGFVTLANILDKSSDLMKKGISVKDIKTEFLDEFDEMFRTLTKSKDYKLRNKGVNYYKFGTLETGIQLSTLTESNVIPYTSFNNVEDGILKVQEEDFFNEDGTLNEEFIDSLKTKKFGIIGTRRLLAPENASQTEFDGMLKKNFGIINTGSRPVFVGTSKGQTSTNISIALAERLKSKYSVKDEQMANSSTKAIGKATEGYNDNYRSSSEAYAKEILRQYPERLADSSTTFDSSDAVWIFGSGSGQVFKNAYIGSYTEKEWANKVEATFNDYHKGLIDNAISQGVNTFFVGDSQGIDQLAKKHLESKGYYAMARYHEAGKYYEMVKDYEAKEDDLHLFGEATVSLDDLGIAVIYDKDVRKEVMAMSEEQILTNEGYLRVQASIMSKLNEVYNVDSSKRQEFAAALIESDKRPIVAGRTGLYESYIEHYLMEVRDRVKQKYQRRAQAVAERKKATKPQPTKVGDKLIVNFYINGKEVRSEVEVAALNRNPSHLAENSDLVYLELKNVRSGKVYKMDVRSNGDVHLMYGDNGRIMLGSDTTLDGYTAENLSQEDVDKIKPCKGGQK